MRIAITDNMRPKPLFKNYITWIHRVAPDAEFVKLSYHLGNGDEVGASDALLLTGGGDVHPRYYGKEDRIDDTEEVNEQRDEFEFDIIERALGCDLPILGICRGLQVMNVMLGGSLIVDLPSGGYAAHSDRMVSDVYHPINILQNSMLSEIVGRENGEVNSVHHQAIDRLGKGLMASAFSADRVIEAAEWVMKNRMPFLLLVQWHPERMAEFENPTSRAVAQRFVDEVRQSVLARST